MTSPCGSFSTPPAYQSTSLAEPSERERRGERTAIAVQQQFHLKQILGNILARLRSHLRSARILRLPFSLPLPV